VVFNLFFSLYVSYLKVMPTLSDKQKKDLAKHIEKKGGSPAERRSHRMKMISRMSRGMSIKQAHADMLKAGKAKASGAKPMVKKAKVKQPTGFERKNRGKGKYSMSNPIDGDLLMDATHDLYGLGIQHTSADNAAAGRAYLRTQGERGTKGLIFKQQGGSDRVYIVLPPAGFARTMDKDDIFDKAKQLDRSGRLVNSTGDVDQK
jgi:hypothetical protein